MENCSWVKISIQEGSSILYAVCDFYFNYKNNRINAGSELVVLVDSVSLTTFPCFSDMEFRDSGEESEDGLGWGLSWH